MMGRREDGQGQFFYAFNLDKVVPADHLVRQIDAILDLSWVHEELAPYYSHTGRPSIYPVLMIRMLIVGYVFECGIDLCDVIYPDLSEGRWQSEGGRGAMARLLASRRSGNFPIVCTAPWRDDVRRSRLDLPCDRDREGARRVTHRDARPHT
jgi:hypothetical protein